MSGKLIIDSALRAAAHVRSSQLPNDVSKAAAAMLSSAPSGGKHTLPDLPYDYNAIERKYHYLLLPRLMPNTYSKSDHMSHDFNR